MPPAPLGATLPAYQRQALMPGRDGATMTQIELSQDRLTVHFTGIDRLLAMRRRLDIPFGNLVNVDVYPNEAEHDGGLRALGARLPAVLSPRTFLQQSGSGPFGTPEAERALVIEAYGRRFDKLVIEVEDPGAAKQAITEAVQAA